VPKDQKSEEKPKGSSTGQTYTRTVTLSQNPNTRRRQIKNGGY